MTVVENPVAETPGGSVAGGRFGDGFVWFAADEDRGFDPVVDVAVGDVGGVGVEWIDAVVEHCAQGLALLERVDASGFDQATVMAWAKGVEQLRRQVSGAGVAVADHLDTAQPFRDVGFFTAKAWLKHHLQLSGAEAYGRVQEARLRQAVGVWNRALAGGQVGVAQSRLMARIAANPRIDADVLTVGVWNLMADAMDVSYVEFERRASVWEALADPVGAADRLERNRVRRNAMMQQTSDGAWELHARLDEVGGPEFLEIFCWYVDREFTRDWSAATECLGEGKVTVAGLARSEGQRRGDALLEMARAAAGCPPGRVRPLPMVNFLLDATTAAAVADGVLLDPAGYRDVVSRTDRGDRVSAAAIIGVSLWALIRRVVVDARGVVIDLGRSRRLFTGSAREAVMLLEATCLWPGCDQPHSWCHADHTASWTERGPTDADNGGPLCARHNYLKELGFVITRDHQGHWHITAPDGTTIC
jgi:hypothetical protein